MPRRPFKKKKSSGSANPFDDSAGSLSLEDPSDALAQEETLGLKLHDSAKLNDTVVSGSSEEDEDEVNDGNANMRKRLGSGDQQVEEEYGFSSITGNGGGDFGGGRTRIIADGLETLDDTLDDLDTEPLERGKNKRGSGRFSFLNTSNWSHPKYCWRRQAMSRMGKSHMNGLGHDERKARRKMLLIAFAVIFVVLAALAGSIAAWQVITKKNSEQQKLQNSGSGSGSGGDDSVVIIPGGENDLTTVVVEDDPLVNITANTTAIDLDLEEDFDPTLNEPGEGGEGIQVDCTKCEESCRPCLGCVDLFGTTEDCDQCEPCQVCMPCFSNDSGNDGEKGQGEDDQGEVDEGDGAIDGGNEEDPETAATIVEMSYLQSYTGIDLATFATEDQIDVFQNLMVGLLDEYIDLDIKDDVEVVCTYNTQRLTSNARRYRKHAGGAGLRRMLRGRLLDTHGDSQQDELDAELQSLGLEKGGEPHTHDIQDDVTPDPCDTPEKETCADMCALNCSGDAEALAVCHGGCRQVCCLSKELNGGGPDTNEENDPDADNSYDPWSNGLLCQDGSPPVKENPDDPVGKCPTSAPTSQPTAAPTTADGDICNTDDELTCKDM